MTDTFSFSKCSPPACWGVCARRLRGTASTDKLLAELKEALVIVSCFFLSSPGERQQSQRPGALTRFKSLICPEPHEK